jgi:hypothetical protein
MGVVVGRPTANEDRGSVAPEPIDDFGEEGGGAPEDRGKSCRCRRCPPMRFRGRPPPAPRRCGPVTLGRMPPTLFTFDTGIAPIIDTDPRALGSRSTVWTAPLLVRSLRDHRAVEVSRKTVSRALTRLGIRRKRPRDQLALRPETWRQAKGGWSAGWTAASARSCSCSMRRSSRIDYGGWL